MSYLKNFISVISYKEAQAWIFTIINFAVLTIYGSEVFANMDMLEGQGLPAFAGLLIVAVCTTVFTVFLIIPTAIVFNRTANERADERDKHIYTESRSLAFWTLFVLGSLSLTVYIFHQIGDLLFHTVLLSILMAQLVYALSISIKYRKTGEPILSEAQD